MSKKVKPLLIVKLNSIEPQEKLNGYMSVVAEGIAKGALVIGPECEIIAFDDNGKLVYPLKA